MDDFFEVDEASARFGMLESERDTADAAVLERAVRVLKRRHQTHIRLVEERIRTAILTLESEALALRGDSRSV